MQLKARKRLLEMLNARAERLAAWCVGEDVNVAATAMPREREQVGTELKSVLSGARDDGDVHFDVGWRRAST